MSLLRRLLGGAQATGPEPPAASPEDVVQAEQAYERNLLRAEAERLSSDLLQRQMRYADRSWTPPAQGGPARADDGDRAEE